MPRRNSTGPQGDGPMTGRGAGNCAGSDVQGCSQPGRTGPMPGGVGFGRAFADRRMGGRGFAGRGGGRRRSRFYRIRFRPDSDPASTDETQSLNARAEWLRAELAAVDQRLNELDSNK